MSTEKPLKDRSLFDRCLDFISHIFVTITGIGLVVMTIIFGWLVFGRYVLNATPTWVEQVSLLLVVYISFLGASVGVHKKTHLGVSVFRKMSPEPVRRLFDFLSYSILAVFGLIMVVYGYKLTLFKWEAQISLIHVSEGWRSLPIVLSGIFVSLSSIGHLIHFFNRTDQDES